MYDPNKLEIIAEEMHMSECDLESWAWGLKGLLDVAI